VVLFGNARCYYNRDIIYVEIYLVTMKGDKVLTYWFKTKLRRWDAQKENPVSTLSDDEKALQQIYDDYEERKRLRKVSIAVLFSDDFFKKPSINRNYSYETKITPKDDTIRE
jgi:hypothetical protein